MVPEKGPINGCVCVSVVCDVQMKKRRRQLESMHGPVDRSKVCMRDLIYMNPVNNPMK